MIYEIETNLGVAKRLIHAESIDDALRLGKNNLEQKIKETRAQDNRRYPDGHGIRYDGYKVTGVRLLGELDLL